jgi:hypothetical protein
MALEHRWQSLSSMFVITIHDGICVTPWGFVERKLRMYTDPPSAVFGRAAVILRTAGECRSIGLRAGGQWRFGAVTPCIIAGPPLLPHPACLFAVADFLD